MASGRDPPTGIGRGGRGAALLAAYKEKAQQIGTRPFPLTEQQSPNGEIRPVGRAALLQNILAGRGRAALPIVELKMAPQVLGRGVGALPAVSFGRGIVLPQNRGKLVPSSGSSASSSSASPPVTSHGSTPSPPIAEMEELSIGKYSGEGGKPIPLEVNYIPLKTSEGKGMFEYHVSFEPVVDSKQMRFKIMSQPDVKATIGSVKSFDGSKLYLPIKLNSEVAISAKLPTDESKVVVYIKYVGVCTARDRLHLYNVLFRRIMSILKMVQVGRNYFDPTGGIPVPQHRLEIWPGYVTAVQEYEGGIMLQADASFRVLRSVTAMEVMRDLMSRHRSQRDEVNREIIGSVILTRYNNKTYRVDDIAWDKNPLSTFPTHDGKEITFADYYKRAYDITIKDLKQPLLLSQAKKKNSDEKEQLLCLVPEICNMTGLTDEMRSDRKIMRDIASHTRVAPGRRQLCFKTFIENMHKTPEAVKVLNDWYLQLDDGLLSLSGRVLDSENIILKRRKFLATPEADWGRQITNQEVLVPVDLDDWIIIYTKRDASKANDFITMLKKVCPDMGIRINHPLCIEIMNDRTESYCSSLRQNINPKVQVAVVIFPNPRDDRYSAVKKVCCLELPIPSQCLNVRTISQFQKLRSVTQKIALQINCKLGGELWALDIPMKNIMVCGLDTYHDAAQRNQSILGFVASINSNVTRWFSRTATQKPGQELGDALKVLFLSALRKYHEVNHMLPQKIFLYRDGVGDGMLDYVSKYEVEQLVSCFTNIQLDYSPSLSVIVVQKRINTRLYWKRNDLQNPPPGTILDHSVTRKKLYDFFLVSQHVGQGTVTPTHFIVVHDTSSLKPQYMQRLTYKMTHLYYNWPGTVRVPAPCQYAHRIAYLIGQNLHKEAHETLADKLFYL